MNLCDVNDQDSIEQVPESLYAVSRSFITPFRKYSQNKLKEFVGHNRTQGSKVNRSSECSLEGSDKIDLSGIFIEETGHISST